MNEKLRKILTDASSGKGDMWKETEVAARILLAGGYPGHNEDLACLEGIEDCIELEKLLSRGSWYFQETDTWKEKIEGKEETDKAVDLCPTCKVYCTKRFIDGRCE